MDASNKARLFDGLTFFMRPGDKRREIRLLVKVSAEVDVSL